MCESRGESRAVTEEARFVYVMTVVAEPEQRVARCWLVPSADFNRLAYRQHSAGRPGRVVLQFSCRAGGDPAWDAYELAPTALGAAVERLLETAPEDAGFGLAAF
jgi:hypothetical protein